MAKINKFSFTAYLDKNNTYLVMILFDIKGEEIFDIKTNTIINHTIAESIIKNPQEFSSIDYQFWLYLECFFQQDKCANIISSSYFKTPHYLTEKNNIIQFNQEDIKFRTGYTIINKIPTYIVIARSYNHKLHAVYIEKRRINDNLICLQEFDVISLDEHEFINDEPNIHKSAISICRSYLELSPILFSKFFGYKNDDEIHIDRVTSWESGKTPPPKSIQKIIKFIKIYGSDNSFIQFLLHDS
jgi:hypothetical protein